MKDWISSHSIGSGCRHSLEEPVSPSLHLDPFLSDAAHSDSSYIVIKLNPSCLHTQTLKPTQVLHASPVTPLPPYHTQFPLARFRRCLISLVLGKEGWKMEAGGRGGKKRNMVPRDEGIREGEEGGGSGVDIWLFPAVTTIFTTLPLPRPSARLSRP
ncbi:hypothetical protein Pmani_036529 [Petrolisthes manimaculis]|uniref:Uncharacterized protein n=1 Tax=Petrolisthes manimaculis TaxID=1843537 RepID=A0AAE1NJY0_9EUCA|nr:hypothetical protein Pmani_036529 [Petrolisthes manimaculis]